VLRPPAGRCWSVAPSRGSSNDPYEADARRACHFGPSAARQTAGARNRRFRSARPITGCYPARAYGCERRIRRKKPEPARRLASTGPIAPARSVAARSRPAVAAATAAALRASFGSAAATATSSPRGTAGRCLFDAAAPTPCCASTSSAAPRASVAPRASAELACVEPRVGGRRLSSAVRGSAASHHGNGAALRAAECGAGARCGTALGSVARHFGSG
jgi:hypothetical protein